MALIVAALHVGLIYGAMHLKSSGERPVKAEPLQVAILAEPKAPPSNPLPPPPIFIPTPTIEPPELDFPELSAPERTITVAARPVSMAPQAVSAPVPKFVSTVEYLRPLALRYPPASRRMREEGLVVLRVLIDERGKTDQVEIHQSSGYERLDRAAQEAVACAKFKPYVEDGVAKASFALVPVEFTLVQRLAQR